MDEPDLTFLCADCGRHLQGIARGSYDNEDPQSDAKTRFTLICCPRCYSPHVVSHDYKEDYQEWYWSLGKVIFPEPGDGLDTRVVPEAVARNFAQAARSLRDATAPTAAALMCRRTLEVICADLGAEGKTLQKKLEHLKTVGKIEPRIYQWADQVLRNLGNDAAHEVKDDVSQEDAADALKFTRAIIEYLYVFEAAYQDFQDRRARRVKPKSTKALSQELEVAPDDDAEIPF